MHDIVWFCDVPGDRRLAVLCCAGRQTDVSAIVFAVGDRADGFVWVVCDC